MKDDILQNLLILNRLNGLNIHDVHAIAKLVEVDHAVFREKPSRLKKLRLSENCIEKIRKINWSDIDEELKWAEEKNHFVLTFFDDHYPRQLKEISAPPLLLYGWGNPDYLNQPQLAMVGSRTPTPIGIEMAEQFAEYLAQSGLVITSGLARGIDTASHRGALRTAQTVAVLGTGLERIYPAENDIIAQKIAENGVVISEFPLQAGANREHFPRRNRLISGLSLGVLVVEAARQSGSLITAKFALEQGREVFAIPGSIHNLLSHGCHQLIREGAKLIETAQDILEELNWKPKPPAVRAKKNQVPPLDDQHKKLLSCIQDITTPLDLIMMRCGVGPEKISPMLLLLELQGYVKSVPGGYCRIK